MSRRRRRKRPPKQKIPKWFQGCSPRFRTFVRDSVSGAESENLETVRMGEIEVVLAYGPDAILAGFVRGVAPRKLSRIFQDTLDAIEQKKAEELHHVLRRHLAIR